ncbi:MAG: hypothetical protein O3B43_06155, partial [Chloroflexi bacterium]|nr:hypothetical protein [Chloroflexota bacterium]
SDQNRVPESALSPNWRSASIDHHPLPPPSLLSGQILVQELPQTHHPKRPDSVQPISLPISTINHRPKTNGLPTQISTITTQSITPEYIINSSKTLNRYLLEITPNIRALY